MLREGNTRGCNTVVRCLLLSLEEHESHRGRWTEVAYTGKSTRRHFPTLSKVPSKMIYMVTDFLKNLGYMKTEYFHPHESPMGHLKGCQDTGQFFNGQCCPTHCSRPCSLNASRAPWSLSQPNMPPPISIM